MLSGIDERLKIDPPPISIESFDEEDLPIFGL